MKGFLIFLHSLSHFVIICAAVLPNIYIIAVFTEQSYVKPLERKEFTFQLLPLALGIGDPFP